MDATKDSQHFAIKIYDLSESTTEGMEDIENEIKILNVLRSDLIIRLYEHFTDLFENVRSWYLVMEHMLGGDLFGRIEKKKCYTENDARAVCQRLLEAVAYCHSRHIVHRDLKPENLLLCSDNNDLDLKVGDFGFARLASSDEALATKCGTLEYVAPEILLGKPYGVAVDMWSLGIITFNLIEGYTPFTKPLEICTAHFQFHEAFWSHVSHLAKDFIVKLLVVDPNKRLSAEQAMQHPWLTASETSMSAENLTDSLAKLRSFNLKRKLRAAVSSVIVTNKLASLGIYPNSMIVVPEQE